MRSCGAIWCGVALFSGWALFAQAEKQPEHKYEPPPIAMPKRRSGAGSPSASDIDRLTTYGTILGRAIGCGLDVNPEMRRVGKWMDKRFPPGTQRQKIYLPIFMETVKRSAIQQRNGNSPDSCGAVRDMVQKFPWP